MLEEVVSGHAGISKSHSIAWSIKRTAVDFQRGRTHDLTDLWAPAKLGRTCLHLAVPRGTMGIIEYLLERATLLQVRRIDSRGCSSLHYAVRSTRCEITIDLLLAGGGNIFAKGHTGCNIVQHAAQWNDLEAIGKFRALGFNELLLIQGKHRRMPSQYTTG